MKKYSTVDLSVPPSGEVRWTAITRFPAGSSESNGLVRRVQVSARSWFEARQLACRELGVDVHALVITRKETR